MNTNEYMNSFKKMVPPKMTAEFDKLVGKYEVRVKELVHRFDLKTNEAKQKGKRQIEIFSKEVKKTRDSFEKRLSDLFNKETEKINEKLEHLVKYLKTLSLEKVEQEKKVTTSPKVTTPKKISASKKTTRKPKKVRPQANA